MKTCPFCAEEIQDAAIVCKHCGRDLQASPTPAPKSSPTVSTAPEPATAALQQPIGRRQGFGYLGIGIGFLLTLVSFATVGFGILLLWIGFGLALKGGAVVRWGGGFILALIFGAVGMAVGGTSLLNDATPARATPAAIETAAPAVSSVPPVPTAPANDLALISAKGYEAEYGGYHIIEGQVKNVTDRPLKNVTAVGIWLDKNGEFIKSDDALIDYNPILPGQSSPFKTMSTGNPAMSKYRIEFKTLMGGTLNVDDRRKK